MNENNKPTLGELVKTWIEKEKRDKSIELAEKRKLEKTILKEFELQGLAPEETAKRTACALELIRISGMDNYNMVKSIEGFKEFDERFKVSSKDLCKALQGLNDTLNQAKAISELTDSLIQISNKKMDGKSIGDFFRRLIEKLYNK